MFKSIRMIAVMPVLTGLFVGSIFLSQIYAQAHQIQNNMRIDEQTGVPVAIYNVNSPQYSGTPEQIARQYLLENKPLLGMAENLSDLELIEVKESPAGHHVGFKQVYQGVPVMRSEMVISINHQNRVSMVINGHKPDISISTAPTIGRNRVLQFAKQAIGAEEADEIFPSRMELMVYEDSVRAFHLVWKVLLFPSELDGEWLVIINLHSGEILEKFNTVIDYVNGTGRVFDPDPGTALRDSTLPDQNDADYPELQPAYDTVILNDLNDAVGGLYYVQGRYVWSTNIHPPYDTIAYKSDPDDFTYNRSQNGFEEVNIYYFVDKQRRYVGSLGFSPTWDVNFGNTPEAIAFDARGTAARNAYYSPTNEYMYFGVPSSYVDAGEDQSVILHEYGHAFHDALIIGGTDNASPGSDTRGISEGLSEYLGVDYRRTTQPSNPF